jgi:integrase
MNFGMAGLRLSRTDVDRTEQNHTVFLYAMSSDFGKLTPTQVMRLSKPGRYADGGKLYLQVSVRGVKSWIFRYTINGAEHYMGLGALHTVSLDQAREKARRARECLSEGNDPLWSMDKPENPSNMTFDDCVNEYHACHRAEWKSVKYESGWKDPIRRYISPYIGLMGVHQITTTHILKALRPIWNTRTVTASRLRGRIERVLAWATSYGYRSGENPARWKGLMENLLPRPSRLRRVEHFASVPYQEIPALFRLLMKLKTPDARALMLTILAATRTAETIYAQWDEVNLESAVWLIPAERTKKGRAHRIPLSPAALAIFRAQQGQDARWVFAGKSRKGQEAQERVMLKLLRDLGYTNYTVHGFRASFRVWAAECSGHSWELAERALAHQVNTQVEAAYQRSDLFERRRLLMMDWAAWCTSPAAAPGMDVRLTPYLMTLYALPPELPSL